MSNVEGKQSIPIYSDSDSTILTVTTGVCCKLQFITQPQSLLAIAALNLWNKRILTIQNWEEELKKPLLRIKLDNIIFFPNVITCAVYNWSLKKKISIPFIIQFAKSANDLIELEYIQEIHLPLSYIFSEDI